MVIDHSFLFSVAARGYLISTLCSFHWALEDEMLLKILGYEHEEIRNSYGILVWNACREDLGVRGRITLNWIWSRVWDVDRLSDSGQVAIGVLFWTWYWVFGSHKRSRSSLTKWTTVSITFSCLYQPNIYNHSSLIIVVSWPRFWITTSQFSVLTVCNSRYRTLAFCSACK